MLDISPRNFISSETFISKFLYIEIRFTDQNAEPLEIEDKTYITSVTKVQHIKMTRYLVQSRDCIFVRGYGFLSFVKNMSKYIGKNLSKNVSGKYSQKLIDHANQSAANALKLP